MEKDPDRQEVSMVFQIKIFGRCKSGEADNRVKDAREKLLEFEQNFNKENLLRMHVNEGIPL